MRIAILGGGGAMGGLFGGYLARGGHDVTLIDVNAAAVDAINANGLIVEEKDGSETRVDVPATTTPTDVGLVDLIVNFVKCYHTADAVKGALAMTNDDTVFLSLQNGWGNAERIADIAGKGRVAVGLTYHSASLIAPGRVRHPGTGVTPLGELDGSSSDRIARIAGAFTDAKLEPVISARILDEIWKKLALNVCTLPTASLLSFFAHQLNQHDGTREMMKGLLAEVVAVAASQGITIDYDERWSAITGLLDKAVGARASMLQDVEAGRRTEIEVINGAIVAAGRKAGIPTPLNDAMVWLIKARQDAYLENAGT